MTHDEQRPDVSELDELAAAPASPTLTGRRTRLRVIGGRDYDYLYDLVSRPEIMYRWRRPPGSVNPARFSDLLWENVFVQFVVESMASGSPIGLVTAYSADLPNGTAYLAHIADPRVQRRGWHLEAPGLFIEYLFKNHQLRKLYGEAIDFNISSYQSAMRRFLRVEGRLRDHVIIAGKPHDVLLLAMYRADWERERLVLGPRAARREILASRGVRIPATSRSGSGSRAV